jgi:hypothetical protein
LDQSIEEISNVESTFAPSSTLYHFTPKEAAEIYQKYKTRSNIDEGDILSGDISSEYESDSDIE